MSDFLNINEAAKLLNVCTKTLKRWEQAGKITSQRTVGGHRRYKRDELLKQAFAHSSASS